MTKERSNENWQETHRPLRRRKTRSLPTIAVGKSRWTMSKSIDYTAGRINHDRVECYRPLPVRRTDVSHCARNIPRGDSALHRIATKHMLSAVHSIYLATSSAVMRDGQIRDESFVSPPRFDSGATMLTPECILIYIALRASPTKVINGKV